MPGDYIKEELTLTEKRTAPIPKQRYDSYFLDEVFATVARQEETQYNPDKYEIYEINLVFKMFRGLKKRVKRRRRKENKPTSHF